MDSWKRLRDERSFRVPLDHSVARGLFPRNDGLTGIVDRVCAFLASSHIRLPEGNSDDPVQDETVHGLVRP